MIIDHGRIVATGTVDALRRSSGRRRIELELEDASAALPPSRASSCSSAVTAPRLLADRDVDPEQVLAEVQRVAGVVAFSYGPPSLAELFVELIES